VGPSVTYKVRNSSGQAHEYLSYQYAMPIDGRSFFISGMRETPQEEFKYLKIPADAKGSIDEFMLFKDALQNKTLIESVAKKMANQSASSADKNSNVKEFLFNKSKSYNFCTNIKNYVLSSNEKNRLKNTLINIPYPDKNYEHYIESISLTKIHLQDILFNIFEFHEKKPFFKENNKI